MIISDIIMPTISGLDLLNMLKSFYFNKIPVILISSLDKQDVILSALSGGACDFVLKPIDFDKLAALVKKRLWLHASK